MLYVEELIGPNTVNTVPPATLDAFRDHGKLRDSLEENIEEARHVLEELEKSGISLDAITADLVADGVKQFADAADKLYGAVAHKRAASLSGGIDHQKLALGAAIEKAVAKSTEEWRASAKIRRLWQKRQIGLDRRRRKQVAGLVEQRGCRRCRRLRGFRQTREGPEIHRCRGARHGRIEPRARSAGGDVPEEVGLSEAARAGFNRSRAGAHDGSERRHLQNAVHRLQQIGRHHRAERDEGLFLRSRFESHRCRQSRSSLHRGDRSRFLAAKGRNQTGLCPHLLRRSDHWRPLFGAVAVRSGAGRGRRYRYSQPDQAYAVDGAFLRRRRAAARKSRCPAWAGDGACRPRRP